RDFVVTVVFQAEDGIRAFHVTGVQSCALPILKLIPLRILRPMPLHQDLKSLAARWADVPAGERANAQLYLSELTAALGVESPRPRGSGYEFEYPVKVVSRDGRESTNFIDLYREGCFVLEAKDMAGEGSDDARLRRAFGQALSYANAVPGGPPPYLIVLDVG